MAGSLDRIRATSHSLSRENGARGLCATAGTSVATIMRLLPSRRVALLKGGATSQMTRDILFGRQDAEAVNSMEVCTRRDE